MNTFLLQKKKRTLRFSLFLTLCMLLSVSLSVLAHGGVDVLFGRHDNDDGGELVMGFPRDVGSLNPHLYDSDMFAQSILYEPLIHYSFGGEIIPWLARDWDISEDGTVYTFYLRDDVHFSDGTKFNAKAVKQNFDAVLDNRQRHAWLELINQMEKVEVVSEYVVQVVLSDSYYPAINEFCLIRPVRFLSPAGFCEENKYQFAEPIGTGAWVVEEYRRDEYLLLKRNENYWGDPPRLSSLKMLVVPDAQSRVMALEAGEIDMVFGLGVIDYLSFNSFDVHDNFVASVSPPLRSNPIVINASIFPTDDRRVRQAIHHAVNKEQVNEVVYGGVEAKAYTLFPDTAPYCDIEGLTEYRFDSHKAVHLLQEAGWVREPGAEYKTKDGQVLHLKFPVDGNLPAQRLFAQLIQQDFKDAGIKMDILTEEKASVEDRQKRGDFHMVFNVTWGPPYDPPSFISAMRVVSHGDFQAQKNLPEKEEIDRLIGAVLVEPDEKTREAMYTDLLTLIHESLVYLPVTYTPVMAVYREDLEGFSFGVGIYEFQPNLWADLHWHD